MLSTDVCLAKNKKENQNNNNMGNREKRKKPVYYATNFCLPKLMAGSRVAGAVPQAKHLTPALWDWGLCWKSSQDQKPLFSSAISQCVARD